MNVKEGIPASESAIATAIHAVEKKNADRHTERHEKDKAKRESFFKLLDKYKEKIFKQVAEEIRGKNDLRRSMPLSHVPGFKDECDKIFAEPTYMNASPHQSGTFPAAYLEEWLFANDLAHHFSSDGPTEGYEFERVARSIRW